MQYTLWSRGRLIGKTDLGFLYREGGFRCGWLHPNELGERLMPAATGVSPALRAEWAMGPDATVRADLLSAVDHEQALMLELRGPDGSPVVTESIGIIDTHYLLSLADCHARDAEELEELDEAAQAEVDAMIEELSADGRFEPWRESLEDETEMPRYQIQIHLVDHDSIP